MANALQTGIFCVLASGLSALPAGAGVRSDTTSLEAIVVTATRSPKALRDVPVVTRVITNDQIRNSDAGGIQELLTEQIPGFEFGYSMSQELSLNLSGFRGNSVLFLLDGERLAGETLDNVDYNRLNLENVGRIEIVRGSASALYGAGAVGGVVNIISKESTEPWRATVGSKFRTEARQWRHNASFGLNRGRWNSQTSFQYSSSDPLQLVKDPFDTQSQLRQVFGSRCLNAGERLVFKASDRSKITARGGYFDRTSIRPNHDDRYTDGSFGLKGDFSIGGSSGLELSYSFDRYDKRRYIGGVHTDAHDYTNRQHILRGLFSTRLRDNNSLSLGADWISDRLSTYQFADRKPRTQYSAGAFTQMDWNPSDWLNLVGSLRYDSFSTSKSKAATARLAAMLKHKGHSLRASYAGGFRAPSLKEMFMSFDMVGIMMIYGNENLKPEKSDNFALALEKNAKIRGAGRLVDGVCSLTASGNYSRYRNRITTTDISGESGLEPGNIYCNDRPLGIWGLELNANYRFDWGLGVNLSYNFMDIDGSSLESQFTLPRPHTATVRFDYGKRITSSYRTDIVLSGRILSKPLPSESLQSSDEAYSIWKLALVQRIRKGTVVSLAADNLFCYRPKIYCFNSPPTTGISLSLGLTFELEKIFENCH